MSDIPQFRRLYRALIDEMRNAGDHEYADKLADLEPLLWRQPLIRPRAAPVSRPIDAETAAAIRQYAANSRDGVHAIAERFSTNIGRVSESLHGRR